MRISMQNGRHIVCRGCRGVRQDDAEFGEFGVVFDKGDARVHGLQRLIAQAEPLDRTDPEVVQQHIGVDGVIVVTGGQRGIADAHFHR